MLYLFLIREDFFPWVPAVRTSYVNKCRLPSPLLPSRIDYISVIVVIPVTLFVQSIELWPARGASCEEKTAGRICACELPNYSWYHVSHICSISSAAAYLTFCLFRGSGPWFAAPDPRPLAIHSNRTNRSKIRTGNPFTDHVTLAGGFPGGEVQLPRTTSPTAYFSFSIRSSGSPSGRSGNIEASN